MNPAEVTPSEVQKQGRRAHEESSVVAPYARPGERDGLQGSHVSASPSAVLTTPTRSPSCAWPFKWLNTAYQERDLGLLGLKTDFLLDPLRSDPRLAELVPKMGLPQ